LTKNVVIVESPAKSKTIGKFLGKNYVIVASKGHIRDLPKSRFGVDTENNFEPKYIAIRGKGDVIKELRKTVKDADKIFLATDPDREGEAISWHISQMLKSDPEKITRVEFNEITKQAVTDAIKNPRPINMNLVDAQQARRILDRIVGYKLSPLLWRKIRKGLSAGRVQSAALRLICDRDEAIRNFVEEEYWTVSVALHKDGKKETFEAKLLKYAGKKAELKDEKSADSILADCSKNDFKVEQLKYSTKIRNTAPPFITSTLQQEASRKLNFTAKKTMSVAQQLYEGLAVGKHGTIGLITYMRTDSTRISELAAGEAKDYIVGKYGAEYYPAKPNKYATKKGAQDAHEAIRPSLVVIEPGEAEKFLTKDQFRLYKLIWDRYVASQMKAAVFDTVAADIVCGNCLFRATGSKVKFKGFTILYTEGADEKDGEAQKKLPVLEEGELLVLADDGVVKKQHFTEPPPLFTEATLVKTLEEQGIGRPSTYAPIVDTLVQRGYIVKAQKRFASTDLGQMVVNMLKEFFPEIIDITFTAQMEAKLDMIEEGNQVWTNVLAEFYGPFETKMTVAEEKIPKLSLEPVVTEEICPNCGKNLIIRSGRFGDFLACPGYPECRFTKPIVKEVAAECPICKRRMVEKKSKRKKTFWGCQNYPDCNFILWDRPLEENWKCTQCDDGILVHKWGRGKEQVICNNENCPSRKKPEGKEKSQENAGD